MHKIYFLFIAALLFSCAHIDIKKQRVAGIRQYENDSLKESIKSLSAVLGVNDTCKDCLLYRGFANKDLKKYDDALEDFTGYIKIDSSAVGYANRASVYYMQNNYKAALKDFSMAYTLDSSPIFLNPICHMLYATGSKDSACVLYKKLSALGDTTFDSGVKTYCNGK